MCHTKALATLRSLYGRILGKFPLENLTYCFAYGSGVLKQRNNESKANMIDFILAVDDAEKWHECNLRMNPGHYSFLSLFGSKAVAKFQTNVPSKVYFNSMVPVREENVVIKYGVITENDLIADLLDWNDLYVAGRLHKPVKIVRKSDSEALMAALQLNLQSAVHATLLLLPENFSEVEFYKTLSSLSYIGDFRMKFGEDKNKIDNIVAGGLEKFKNLYSPILKMMEDYVEVPTGNEMPNSERCCRQDISPSAKHFHLNHLPRTPQRKLVQFWNKGSRNRQDTEDVLRAMAFDQDCGEVFQSILSNIVWDSSIRQSLKGILTAGVFTSVLYSSKKIGKMLNARTPKTSKKIIMLPNKDVRHVGREKFTVERTSSPQPSHFESDYFGPVLPPHLLKKSDTKDQGKEKIYGPTLPDHLSQDAAELNEVTSQKPVDGVETLIGPAFPKELRSKSSEPQEEPASSSCDIDENFGPSTALMADGETTGSYVLLNAQKLSKTVPEDTTAKRETWMTELPKKRGANFGLLPRHFKSQVPTEKECDDSVWTETPADKKREDGLKKDHKEILNMKRLKERDKQMEKLAKKAAKKLRKKESLLEMHIKSMKKKKKKELKKQKKKGITVPERRPFDRNIDLQVRKIDESQRRAILNKSQFLNDRFAPVSRKSLSHSMKGSRSHRNHFYLQSHDVRQRSSRREEGDAEEQAKAETGVVVSFSLK